MRAHLALILTLLPALPLAAEPEPDLDSRVRAITDAITDDALADAPSRTALLRPPGADYASLPDHSVAGVAARNARLDGWLAELAGIDRATLADPTMRLAYDFARSRLEDGQRLRVCRPELWRVSQMGNAWLVEFADAALAQPIETPELRKAALARAAALPHYVDD